MNQQQQQQLAQQQLMYKQQQMAAAMARQQKQQLQQQAGGQQASAAVGGLANAAPPPPAPPSKPPKRKRPTDRGLPRKLETFVPESKLFTQLQEFEKRLDATIVRKRIDINESLSRPAKLKRTLRLFISNLASDQFEEPDAETSMEVENSKAPSWTLRIEGRLLDHSNVKKPSTPPQKFSHFVKSVHVELQRDASLYPDGNIIEWHKQPGATDCDGFEIKRKGDTDTPARIFIHLDNSPDKFKLSPDLAQVLDIHTDTKPNVIMALWQYIKTYKLQDPEDKRAVNCNEALLKIFGYPKLMFTQIPELLNRHLNAPDPIVIDYTIRVDKEYHIGQFAYDVEVEVDDPIKFRMTHFITENNQIAKELATYDEKIISIIQTINQSKMKRDFFLSFSLDPVGFIKQWMASQSRDMEIILGDMRMNVEETRAAGFYDQPWVNEAIFRYLNDRIST